MHRPSLRVHARDLQSQAGILKHYVSAMKWLDPRRVMSALLNRFKRHYGASRYAPHQGAREKERRRIGGFYTLRKDFS